MNNKRKVYHEISLMKHLYLFRSYCALYRPKNMKTALLHTKYKYFNLVITLN